MNVFAPNLRIGIRNAGDNTVADLLVNGVKSGESTETSGLLSVGIIGQGQLLRPVLRPSTYVGHNRAT